MRIIGKRMIDLHKRKINNRYKGEHCVPFSISNGLFEEEINLFPVFSKISKLIPFPKKTLLKVLFQLLFELSRDQN